MTEKEKAIRVYMKNLNLSRKEAEQMWTDEQEDNFPELTAEQKAVVKEMTQADRKMETAPRKRERKADKVKQEIISFLADSLANTRISAISIPNAEREINFTFDDEEYQLLLIRHRPSKK